MVKYAPAAETKNKIGLKGAEEYHWLGVANATRYAKEVLKIAEVDYGGNKIIANICNKALLALSKRKVPMPRAIRVVPEEFAPGSNHAAYYNAGFLDSPGEILINPNHEGWTDPRIIKERARQHKISTGDKHHFILHEMGELARHYSVGWERYNDTRSAYRQAEEEFQALGSVTLHSIHQQVSEYAAKNHNEFVAEMFAALQLGRELDDDLMILCVRFGGVKIMEFNRVPEQ